MKKMIDLKQFTKTYGLKKIKSRFIMTRKLNIYLTYQSIKVFSIKCDTRRKLVIPVETHWSCKSRESISDIKKSTFPL